MENKMTTVFSMRLAGYLMYHGFVLCGMTKSRHTNNKNVYFFVGSEELKKSIQEYKNIQRK